ATHAQEMPRQMTLVLIEELGHEKYLDPDHQKEVYQETMDVIQILQGEIQCLKEKSKKLEQRKNAEALKEDLDEVKE
ncbi:hypothetical protein KI387_018714, partial [Taxus chinensis]